jgi:hypothetical protein
MTRDIGSRHWLLLALVMLLLLPATSSAEVSVGISVRIAPPALPVYAQPICPGPGYIWTPGYWAYAPDGYYWVPGTWVMAPRVGFLWTPGYWGWGGGAYVWHGGYWGPRIGFYGGVNYGFGYVGVGYVGGYWNHGVFAYNRAVNNVNVTVIHNTYNRTVIDNTAVNRVSYNGGTGGINARATPAEEAAARGQHIQPTSAQIEHEHAASTNRAQFASVNHGRPALAATPRPGAFDRGAGNATGNHHNDAHGSNNAAHATNRPHPSEGGGEHRGGEERSR